MKKKYLISGIVILLFLVVICAFMLGKDTPKTTKKENPSNQVQEELLPKDSTDSDSQESESGITTETPKKDSVKGDSETEDEEELDAFIEEEENSNSSVEQGNEKEEQPGESTSEKYEDVGEVTLPFVPFD